MVPTWHTMEAEEGLNALQSDSKGLSDEEAGLRLHKFGYNELEKLDWILVTFFASWGFFVIPEVFMKRKASTTT